MAAGPSANDYITLLYKKYLGTVNSVPNTKFTQLELPLFGKQRIFAEQQIFSQSIPAGNDPMDILGTPSIVVGFDSTHPAYLDRSRIWDGDPDINLDGQLGTKYIYSNNGYEYIAKYDSLALTMVSSNIVNYKTFTCTHEVGFPQYSNLLDNQIPYNYTPRKDYQPKVYLNTYSNGTFRKLEIPSNSSTYPWILDSDAGVLMFLGVTAIDLNIQFISMTFWRYEGLKGVGSLIGPYGPCNFTLVPQVNSNLTLPTPNSLYKTAEGINELTFANTLEPYAYQNTFITARLPSNCANGNFIGLSNDLEYSSLTCGILIEDISNKTGAVYINDVRQYATGPIGNSDIVTVSATYNGALFYVNGLPFGEGPTGPQTFVGDRGLRGLIGITNTGQTISNISYGYLPPVGGTVGGNTEIYIDEGTLQDILTVSYYGGSATTDTRQSQIDGNDINNELNAQFLADKFSPFTDTPDLLPSLPPDSLPTGISSLLATSLPNFLPGGVNYDIFIILGQSNSIGRGTRNTGVNENRYGSIVTNFTLTGVTNSAADANTDNPWSNIFTLANTRRIIPAFFSMPGLDGYNRSGAQSSANPVLYGQVPTGMGQQGIGTSAGTSYANPNKVGFGLTFAKKYLLGLSPSVRATTKVLIIGCGHGGGASVMDTTNSTFNWGRLEDYRDTSVNPPVTRYSLIAAAKSKISSARPLIGSGSRVKGILWHQGETDAPNLYSGSVTIANYLSKLKTTLTNIRTECSNTYPGNAGLIPIMVGELCYEMYRNRNTGENINDAYGNAWRNMNTNVISQIPTHPTHKIPYCKVVKAGPAPAVGTIPAYSNYLESDSAIRSNTYMPASERNKYYSRDTVNLSDKQLHFSTQGYRELGVRYYNTFKTFV